MIFLCMHACMHPPHSTSTLLSCLVLREEPTTRIIFQNVNGRIRLETRKWNFLFMTMHFSYVFFLYIILFHIDTFIHWIGIETKSSAHHDFRLILNLDSFSTVVFDIYKKVLKIFEKRIPHFDSTNIDKLLCFECTGVGWLKRRKWWPFGTTPTYYQWQNIPTWKFCEFQRPNLPKSRNCSKSG